MEPTSVPDPAAGPWTEDEARCAVLATGPRLQNQNAALRCGCSCHPRPAQPALHDGGVRCPCQLTSDERRHAFDALLQLSADLALDEALEAEQEEFTATATDLDVRARVRVSACPLVVTGVVDGQAFYFRERHGQYTVEIPTGDPAVDLYDHHDHPSVRLIDGAGSPRPAAALRLSVARVRDHLRAQSCAHPGARAFCADCGSRMDPAPA